MTFQKNPKQKSSYPAMLAGFEKKRQPAWVKQNFKINKNSVVKTKFTTFLRKNP